MAKNQNHQPSAVNRPDIESTMETRVDAAGVLAFLWKRVAPRLTESELAGLAGAAECVSESLELMADMLNNIGGVGTAGEIQAPALVWPLVEQLQTLSALAAVANDATSRLLRPSLYREGGIWHEIDRRQMAGGN